MAFSNILIHRVISGLHILYINDIKYVIKNPSRPLPHGRAPEDLRVLKVVAEDEAAFVEVIAAAGQDGAASAPVHRISVRCQTAFTGAYRQLVQAGFRVHWTDLRMTLAGHEERTRAPGVLMSNWEI